MARTMAFNFQAPGGGGPQAFQPVIPRTRFSANMGMPGAVSMAGGQMPGGMTPDEEARHRAALRQSMVGQLGGGWAGGGGGGGGGAGQPGQGVQPAAQTNVQAPSSMANQAQHAQFTPQGIVQQGQEPAIHPVMSGPQIGGFGPGAHLAGTNLQGPPAMGGPSPGYPWWQQAHLQPQGYPAGLPPTPPNINPVSPNQPGPGEWEALQRHHARRFATGTADWANLDAARRGVQVPGGGPTAHPAPSAPGGFIPGLTAGLTGTLGAPRSPFGRPPQVAQPSWQSVLGGQVRPQADTGMPQGPLPQPGYGSAQPQQPAGPQRRADDPTLMQAPPRLPAPPNSLVPGAVGPTAGQVAPPASANLPSTPDAWGQVSGYVGPDYIYTGPGYQGGDQFGGYGGYASMGGHPQAGLTPAEAHPLGAVNPWVPTGGLAPNTAGLPQRFLAPGLGGGAGGGPAASGPGATLGTPQGPAAPYQGLVHDLALPGGAPNAMGPAGAATGGAGGAPAAGAPMFSTAAPAASGQASADQGTLGSQRQSDTPEGTADSGAGASTAPPWGGGIDLNGDGQPDSDAEVAMYLGHLLATSANGTTGTMDQLSPAERAFFDRLVSLGYAERRRVGGASDQDLRGQWYDVDEDKLRGAIQKWQLQRTHEESDKQQQQAADEKYGQNQGRAASDAGGRSMDDVTNEVLDELRRMRGDNSIEDKILRAGRMGIAEQTGEASRGLAERSARAGMSTSGAALGGQGQIARGAQMSTAQLEVDAASAGLRNKLSILQSMLAAHQGDPMLRQQLATEMARTQAELEDRLMRAQSLRQSRAQQQGMANAWWLQPTVQGPGFWDRLAQIGVPLASAGIEGALLG